MTTLFIGIGAMGAPMARNLARGVDLLLHDVNGDAADELAADLESATTWPSLDSIPPSIREVVLMLPSSREVEQVLVGGGLLDALAPGALVADMSSSSPESTRELAQKAAERGIGYVDAPVSGGVARAATGELSIMVGAEPEDFERAQPLLQLMGSTVIHVGGPGAGDAAKALNNLLSATNLAAAAEVLTAAARFGIDPEIMLEVINSSSGRSQASEVKYPSFVLSRTFASGFSMDLLLKDLSIAQGLTSNIGLTAPVTSSARKVVAAARRASDGRPDHTELVRLYEVQNGVVLRGAPGASQRGAEAKA